MTSATTTTMNMLVPTRFAPNPPITTPRQSLIRTNPRATPTAGRSLHSSSNSSEWILIAKHDFEDVNNNNRSLSMSAEAPPPPPLPLSSAEQVASQSHHLLPLHPSHPTRHSHHRLHPLEHHHHRQLSADSAIKSNSTASSSPILALNARSTTPSPVEWTTSQIAMESCPDEHSAVFNQSSGSSNCERTRELDEEFVHLTESIVDDIFDSPPLVSAATTPPTIVTTHTHSDEMRPLVCSMRVTRIGAGSPPSPKLSAPSKVLHSHSSESDFADQEDSLDNIYDETPELSDLDDCLRTTQPIWHLPHVDRATVLHYLQTKPVGVFIVRKSSKISTFALSVRLPAGRGPHIEHYLVEHRASKHTPQRTIFALEGSEHEFDTILGLVVHYAHCCDELPTPLCLPQVLCPPTPITNDQRTSIASLALLGQEFWQSRIAQLKGTLPKDSLASETLTCAVTTNVVNNTSATSLVGHNSPGACRQVSPCSSASVGSSTSLSAPSSTPTPRPRTSVTSEHNSPTPLITVGLNVTKMNLNPSAISLQSIKSESPPPPLPPKSFPVERADLFEKPNLPPRVVPEIIAIDAPPPLPPRPGGKSGSHLNEIAALSDAAEIAEAKREAKANYVQPKKDPKPVEQRFSGCDIYTQTPLLEEGKVPEGDRIRARASSSLSLTSSFYMDPVDALAVVQQVRRRRSARSRHSDPELSSREPSNILGNGDYSIFQPGHALGNIQSFDALLEKFRAKFATLESAYGSGGAVRAFLNAERAPSNHAPDGSGFYTIDSNWEWRDCNRSPDECAKLISINKEARELVRRKESVREVPNPLPLPEKPEPNANIVVNGEQRHSKSSVLAAQYDNLTKEEAKRMKAQQRRSASKPENSVPLKPEPVVEETPVTKISNSNDDFGSLDRTIALLNIDLINFNAFLQAQEADTSAVVAKPTKISHEDDYDRVAEEDAEANALLRARDEKKRSQRALQRSSQSTEPVMLSIVENISAYVFELAARKNNTFAMSIDNFIQCTRDSSETSPTMILGYVRQFMNGMKNYLIKHGEAEFGAVVSRERARLRPDQFLNLDSILECALQALVIKPLKSHLYDLCVANYTRDGSIVTLQQSIRMIQSRREEEFGVNSEQLPKIERAMRRLQRAYSPIAKLEQLLQVVSALSGGVRNSRHSFSGDALIPALQYAICHCGMVYVEVELDYTLGLLHSSVLNGGDGNYYLALWSSAVEMLKTIPEAGLSSGAVLKSANKLPHSLSSTTTEEGASMVRILIPDELTSSISCKSVPVRRNMTARELCRMIGHTYRIANTETHGLYRVRRDGAGDVALAEHECPQSIQIDALSRGEPAPIFAFKRTDAQFVWPTTFAAD